MRLFDADAVAAALPYGPLIEALRDGFASPIEAPERGHHTVPAGPGEAASTLLVMPAWRGGEGAGVKLVTVSPAAAARGAPTIAGVYVLFDADGRPAALLDGPELTARRTACVSALAADLLAPRNAEAHLMVGAGALAPHLIRAHRAVRPLRRTLIWARRPEAAHRLAAALREEGLDAVAREDLQAAAGEADIVSCATLAVEPVIRGAWLKPACHLDLVGAFRPDMREGDDAALRGARIYVDTLTALTECGELAIPLATGMLQRRDILGDLKALVAERPEPGGRSVFKAVGTAAADYVAARLAVELT